MNTGLAPPTLFLPPSPTTKTKKPPAGSSLQTPPDMAVGRSHQPDPGGLSGGTPSPKFESIFTIGCLKKQAQSRVGCLLLAVSRESQHSNSGCLYPFWGMLSNGATKMRLSFFLNSPIKLKKSKFNILDSARDP
jgi:hypothetical protein